MRIKIPSDKSYEDAMDDVIALAPAVKSCFPQSLQYLVLLMDVDPLWEAIIIEDEARWEEFEDIRLGRFDDRILLGCYDMGGGMQYEVLPEDQEKIDRYEELVAILPDATMPKQFIKDEFTWKRVERIAKERKHL